MDKILRVQFYSLILFAASGPAFCCNKVDREVADRLLAFQNDNGGWPKNYEWNEPLDSEINKERLDNQGGSTIDDGATYSEIRYLSRAYHELKDERYKIAAVKGVEYLLQAQYDNGGWPQFYPYHEEQYEKYITFNDDAMIGVMKLLRDIAEGKPEFKFVDEDMKKRAGKAVKKGIECILKCQVVVNGKKTVWCAQHDEKNFEPRKARSYELASLSGLESVGIVYFLMEIQHPTPEIIEAVDSAVAWFDEVKIEGLKLVIVRDKSLPEGRDRVLVKDSLADPMWGRFYDIETYKPIFCSRDGIPKSNLSEISAERRNGYCWIGGWANDLLKKDYPRWKEQLKR